MIEHCRICKSSSFEEVIDLGIHALSGVFPRAGELVAIYPLQLVKCTSCSLVQLSESVEPSLMYGSNYGYRSSLNQSMVDHLAFVANLVKSHTNLKFDDLVVDIGSNDGTFLRNFVSECVTLGIDPTARKFAKFYHPMTLVISDFFHKRYIPKKAKVITCFAMLYDLEDPVGFANDVYDSLAPDGLWVFEVADFPLLASMGIYDFICHEHLEYYGLRQLMTILSMSGFCPVSVDLTSTNGGSILIVAKKGEHSYKVADTFDSETYSKSVIYHREELKRVLSGKCVAGLGASTKGNTLLQFCGFTKTDIKFIADCNEDKWGKVTPGTNIPIVPEINLLESPNYSYLVLPWHFRKGFIEKHPDKNLIFPFPVIEEVSCVLSSTAQ